MSVALSVSKWVEVRPEEGMDVQLVDTPFKEAGDRNSVVVPLRGSVS